MKNSSYLCETNDVGVEIKVEVTLPPVKKVLKKNCHKNLEVQKNFLNFVKLFGKEVWCEPEL